MMSDNEKENSSPFLHVNDVIEISTDSESSDDVFCEPDPRPRGSSSRLKNGNSQPKSQWGSSDISVIELTDSESSNSDLPDILSPFVKGPGRKEFTTSKKQRSPPGQFIPLYVDTSDDEEADKDCILVLNDPPGSHKPIRSIPSTKGLNTRKGSMLLDSPKQNDVTGSSEAAQKSPSKRSRRLMHDAQLLRQNYAKALFAELNRDVFGDRLPKSTTLEWSKRLLTTAGRARWHRSPDGVDITKIELASKILDCDERIRNTLSHEMCHLACWVIDNQPREGHGQLFKSWARKVMVKRSDIHISTRHSYEISYPYEWKCEKCSKIYGRYSKSIRPDECVCGACRTGKLIPLFVERKARTPKVSRMAIANPRDSPYSILEKDGQGRFPPSTNSHDTDILELADILGGISIDNARD